MVLDTAGRDADFGHGAPRGIVYHASKKASLLCTSLSKITGHKVMVSQKIAVTKPYYGQDRVTVT